LISTDAELIAQNSDRRLACGQIERIGGAAIITFIAEGKENIGEIKSLSDIHAVGHRVVHGGEKFTESVLITDEVLRGIEDCIELAPLHNPANINGIQAARQIFGRTLPQAAVFDTAFHQTLPEQSYLYAIPYQFYRRHRIRRYGFHGTSHRYVAYRYRTINDIPRGEVNIITLHLGNGCSIAAIKGGNSFDTSMGMTPLEGLVMGTRSGDLDPAIFEFIGEKEGLSPHEVETLLNKQSGLLGISGLTNDMRELLAEIEESGDRRARLAVEIFCYRARKYIGSYLAAMNGADAILFTGGIGENSAKIRSRICDELKWLGVELDPELNEAHTDGLEGVISGAGSRIKVCVVPTNEELLIARDTVRLIESGSQTASPAGV
jgi:acetate kinase